jgi:hypothetical protein
MLRLLTAMPELWSAGRVATFLGYSYDHFRKEVRFWEGVPQPLKKPGHERWLSTAWIAWAEENSATVTQK